MPWSTPTLREVRSLIRDAIRSELPGADAIVPNSVLRVTSDVQGALCHLNLQYLDWLAKQLMPDTAENIWLDRHADIWLTNSDGSTGRKMATLARGSVTFIGPGGTVVPRATELGYGAIAYETVEDVTLADNLIPTEASIQALDPGSAGNLAAGTSLVFLGDVPGVGNATVVELNYGTDTEKDDDLRIRVLERIRQPPMGGDQSDYVAWAKAVPGVTRAWCYPLEMGIGTVTVRFMCDELRADRDGFPAGFDIQTVQAYLDTVRPVAVKDIFVVAPIPYRIDVNIVDLRPDTESVRAGIEQSLQSMLFRLGKPGQTIYAAWKYHAIMEAPGVESFDLKFVVDDLMPSPGHMPVLGDIVYAASPPAT
jgi:uncharacterized phage protein gp47/JayE